MHTVAISVLAIVLLPSGHIQRSQDNSTSYTYFSLILHYGSSTFLTESLWMTQCMNMLPPLSLVTARTFPVIRKTDIDIHCDLFTVETS